MAQGTPLRHLTRHSPRRAEEIISGGSLYWVIAGTLLLRQRIISVEPAVREDGSACAALMLDPVLVAVTGRPVKAFQGWRYLPAEDAPPDLDANSIEAGLPPELAQKLRSYVCCSVWVSTSVANAASSCCGDGGQPRTSKSTGTCWMTPPNTA